MDSDRISSLNLSSHLNCSYEKHKWLLSKFYLSSVVATLIAIVGIFGNVTTVVILAQPKMRSSSNLYLTCLAIFDSFLLLTAVLLYPFEYLFEYTDAADLYLFWSSYVRYVYTASHTSQTASVYTTIAVTVERCVATVNPRLAATSCACSFHGSFIVVGLVFAFSIVFNLPRYWELNVTEVTGCRGFGSRKLEMGALLRNNTYATVFGLWVTSIVMVFGPFLLLLVFNGIIVQSIRRSRQQYRKAGGIELRQKIKNATIILVVIVIIFLICNVWGFVTSLLEYVVGFDQLYRNNEQFYSFSREAINLLAIINSSLNFFIYLIFDKEFRFDVKKMYRCRWLTCPCHRQPNQVADESHDTQPPENLDDLAKYGFIRPSEDTALMRKNTRKLSNSAQLQPTHFVLINSQNDRFRDENYADFVSESPIHPANIQLESTETLRGRHFGTVIADSLLSSQTNSSNCEVPLNPTGKATYGTHDSLLILSAEQ